VSTSPDGQELLAEIEAKRGYVLEMHKVLAAADPDFLRSYEAFMEAAYLGERSLDRRTKELVYVAVLAALGSSQAHQLAHMRAALAAGATAGELLEVLEQVLPPAGVPRFMEAVEAWSVATDG
jgi:4-carboxymuconolactone decarboxylase